MMDAGVRGIAESLRLRAAQQDALVATPSNSLPSLAVQQCLAFDNPYSTLGLHKALPPLLHDEQSFGLDSFTSSGGVWIPKNKKDAELLITHVMSGVKDGSASCGVVLHKDFSVHSVRFEENQFQELEQRGAGVSGHVTACKDNSGNKFVRKHMKDGKKLREQEVMSMNKLCHPNICKVYALACHAGSVDIMMQDAGRSLYACLREMRNNLGPGTGSQYYGVVQDLACQGFRALHHMHRRKVYHLDLKPDNILVDLTSQNQLHLMLADFGSSLIGDQMMSFSMQLTPEYWAPELWQRLAPCLRSKEDYNKLQKEQFPPQASFDTYAMALTVYFMCTLRHLMKFLEAKLIGTSNDTQKSFLFKSQLMTEHAHHIAGWATQGPFVYDEPLPQILQELLKNTLHPDPEKRWTDSQAVEWLSGNPVIDEDEEEEETEKELQVPTQVHDTVSGYTGESMVVEEDVWQSAVTSFHDEADHLFGTASFQSLQDHDVKGQQRLGLLVRNVQPSQDVTFQASKHELVAGAPTNLPTSFRQSVVAPEGKQHMVLAGYYTVQLNNSFALMELDEVSPAADQASGVDLDLSLRVTTSQDCIPDVAVPAGLCQAEEKQAWKPTKFGVQGGGDVAFAGDALGMRRNMNVGTQPLTFEGEKGALEAPVHPLAPDGVNSILSPIGPLGKGGSARAPSRAVYKKGKTVASKGHAHPYGIKSASGTGKHTIPLSIGKKMIFYPGVVDKQPSPQHDLPSATFFVAGSAAPTPAARTMQEVSARALQPITRAEDAIVVARMPCSSSARYINPWSVEASEQAQSGFPVSVPVQEALGVAQRPLPEVHSTVIREVQVQPSVAFQLGSPAQESIQQQAGNIPFFGLLL